MNIKQLFGTTLRSFLCYLPYINVIPKPYKLRKDGISAMIRTKNEEDWIELSILSIKDFADEIIIIDASTDNTPNIIEKVKKEHNLNIRLIRYEDKDKLPTGDSYTEQSNIALKNTQYRWILRWDGDMVARTDGENSILNLKRKLMELDNKKYYIIFFSQIILSMDVFHCLKNSPIHREGWLHTYSPNLVYKNMGRFEELQVPIYYKRVELKEIYGFHCNIKSAERMFLRSFWTDWRDEGEYTKFPKLEDYVKSKIREKYNTEDINEAIKIQLKKYINELVPYDSKKYGDYPKLLKEYLKNPKYKVIYKDGKPIGRNDII